MAKKNAQFPGPGPGLDAPAPAQDDLNNIDIEAPGGTQATHNASEAGQSQEQAGPRIAAGRERVMRGVSTVRDAGRDYLAQHDPNEMRADLEDRIRRYPIASMAVALLSGYLIAKIVD